MRDIVDAKFRRDLLEAKRITGFHQAIVQEAKHSGAIDALAQRSMRFSQRMTDEFLALIEASRDEGEDVVELLPKFFEIVMRIHREEMDDA